MISPSPDSRRRITAPSDLLSNQPGALKRKSYVIDSSDGGDSASVDEDEVNDSDKQMEQSKKHPKKVQKKKVAPKKKKPNPEPEVIMFFSSPYAFFPTIVIMLNCSSPRILPTVTDHNHRIQLCYPENPARRL